MNQALVRGIILFIGIASAFMIGGAAANFDTVFLLVSMISLGALLFVSILWKYVLGLSLLIALLGLSWYPMGISLGSDELSYLLMVTLIFTQIWRNFETRPRLDEPAERYLGIFVRVGIFWIIYVGIELAWRLLEIRFYGESGMKNVVKSYVGILMSTFCMIYFIQRPTTIVALRNPAKLFLMFLLFSLILGIGLRSYQSSFGGSVLEEQTGRLVAGPFVVPGILIVEGIYVLRALAPLAALSGMLFLTTRLPNGKRLPGTTRLLASLVLVFGLIGAFLSGGRASIALYVIFVLVVLVLRRAYFSLFVCGLFFVLLTLVVNVSYRSIESFAPPNVLRSISWMVLDGSNSASGDINASTRWRQILFEESLKEWDVSWRTRLVGRGYKGFSETDSLDNEQGGYYEKIDIALQRGATHSLLSDSLLIFGIIGATLYYGLLFSQILLGLAILRTPGSTPITRCFAWIVAIMGLHAIVVGTLGGSFLGMLNALLVLIAVTECWKDHKLRADSEEVEDESTAIDSDTKSFPIIGAR